VAIAANRGENLDGHFGSCERFLVYQVGPDALKLIGIRSTVEADAAEDKNAARSALINDCQIVTFSQSVARPQPKSFVPAFIPSRNRPAARRGKFWLNCKADCPAPLAGADHGGSIGLAGPLRKRP
jgi:hypothetical protein